MNGVESAGAHPSLVVRLRAGGRQVRVHVWPAADGGTGRPILIYYHGITDSGEVFRPLAEALGRRWTIIAPDAPGHGGTPWTPAPRHHIADHAAAALAVLDQLPQVAGRRADVVVAGHSMGALTAAHLAAARPGIVRHLLLEDPARASSRRPVTAAVLRTWIASLQQLSERALIADLRAREPDWPDDELPPWAHSKREMSLDALSVPIAWGEPLVALLAGVRAPVTLVHGLIAQGGAVSAVAARRCAAACRGGCEIIQFRCGHTPRREAREPFIAVLASILGRCKR